jgi:hypothetical protein
LLVGIGLAALVLLLAVGTGAFLMLRSRPADDTAGQPAQEVPSTLIAQAPTTTVPPVAVATAAPSATSAPAATPPPTAAVDGGGTAAAGTARTPPGRTGAGGATGSAPSRATPPLETAPAREAAVDPLERAPQLDGRQAGEDAAERYRSPQGSTSNSGYGTNRRFARREKVPSDVTPAEKRAVAVLLNVLQYESLHHQRTGRYGDFKQILPRQVANPNVLEHAGYRFDISVESDGFKVVATPQSPGLRGFVADDSGFIRYADE